MPAILNPVRSRSGIAVVTVLTKPYPCPGRCLYCPTEVRAPKSYLLTEPLVQRAAEYGYDPYRQTAVRIQALRNTGHPTAKIELMVKGGTWSSYPQEYQRQFIRECLDAANQTASSTLEEAQQMNETAQRRIVGLTVETRPDCVTPEEIRRLREMGVTRVELGVQSLDEEVLRMTQRDHGTEEVRRATQMLREAGIEVLYTGLHQSVDQIVSAAMQEDVDVVGLSILSGVHMTIVPQLIGALRAKGAGETRVVVGGFIPEQDERDRLERLGAAKVFDQDHSLSEIVDFIRSLGPTGDGDAESLPRRERKTVGVEIDDCL